MKSLNRKGFTLVEMLAVVVILGIIMTIMVPSVNHLINKNRDDSYKSLENNIRSAAQAYLSDYRYEITLASNLSSCNSNDTINVSKINSESISNSQLGIDTLINKGYLKADKDGNIKNPRTSQNINLHESSVLIQYSCSKKDYIYGTVNIVE